MTPTDIINFFKNLFNKTTSGTMKYNGIAPDIRSTEEKAKDWNAEEIVAAGSVMPKFRTVTKNSWKHYSLRNQGSSGSCVAQTTAKMLEVRRKLEKGDTIKMSASPIYKKRSNRPAIGMTGNNALDIAVKSGSCRESVMRSENLTDQQMDATPYPMDYESLNNDILPTSYVTLPISFNYVAGIVEREGCAMIWVNTDYNSWARDIPRAGGHKGEVVHSVTAVDTFTYNGVQYILIEDSWGSFGEFNGQRLITKSFFEDAVFYAAAFLTFTFNVDNSKHFTPFNTDLAYGQRSPEVVRLQDFMRSKGYFPKETNSTGYYGNITAKSVYQYQVANNVAPLAELDSLAGKRVGPSTRNKMNTQL